MKKIVSLVLAVGALTASANAGFHRAFDGAPGFYKVNLPQNWKMVEPLNPQTPTFVLVTDQGVIHPTITNCNIIDEAVSIPPNMLNEARDMFASLSAAQMQAMLAQGFSAAGTQYVVSNVTDPIEDDQDSNPAVSFIYTLADTALNLTVRIKATQVFNTNGITTLSCSTVPASFQAQLPEMTVFADSVEFLSGENEIVAMLNTNSLASLNGEATSLREPVSGGDHLAIAREMLTAIGKASIDNRQKN